MKHQIDAYSDGLLTAETVDVDLYHNWRWMCSIGGSV